MAQERASSCLQEVLASSGSGATSRVVNASHRRTLAAVFAEPVPRTLEWRRVEGLLLTAGARLLEGDGSRVRFVAPDGRVAIFHRPHPAKEAKPYQVRAAREFLEDMGVEPP